MYTLANISRRNYQFKLTPAWGALLLILGLFLLIFTADFLSPPQIKLSASLPFDLKPNTSLVLTVPGSTSRDIMALDILSSERPDISIKQTNGVFSKITASHCNKKIDQYTCHIPFQRTNHQTILNITTQTPHAYINTINLRLLKSFSNPLKETGSLLPLLLIITLFLPVLWTVHHKKKLSQYLILSLSLTGLCWLQPGFTSILLIYLYAIYRLGMAMQHARLNQSKEKNKALLLYTGLLTSFAFLIFWKYGTQIAQSIFANPGHFSIAMPLGISYFIIRVIDTVLRWYRGEVKHTSFREFLCFVIFPATIPAGPIDSIDNFMRNRLDKINTSDIAYGLSRILLGASKKIIIVGFILQHMIFSGETNLYTHVVMAPALASTHDVLMLPFLMMLYAYFDFSAYSDIAIGFSRLMGYQMVENFYWPIFSKNIQTFWKRWHMSLSGWCMRNIYMPATIKTRNTILPLYITMLTVGLWHAFSLSWFFWAMHHGTGLNLFAFAERRKYFKKNKLLQTSLSILRIPLTMTFVASGYYFAFIADFNTAFHGYTRFWTSFIPGFLYK
jgi:alginate O-acetyltransferase complex protein AlgI